jgi:hypothetical protein
MNQAAQQSQQKEGRTWLKWEIDTLEVARSLITQSDAFQDCEAGKGVELLLV